MDKSLKILMIGDKNSGKTTYMASAYGIMRKGKFDFHVKGSEDVDGWLSGLYQKLRSGTYPLPTDKRGSYAFDLLYKKQKILSFSWVDYYGGVIHDGNSQQLTKDLKEADAIMLFAEAPALLKKDDSVTQLQKILYLLSSALLDRQEPVNIIAILTKYDLVGLSAPLAQVSAPFDNFREIVSGNENISFRTVPVACTPLWQTNVDLPLIDILHAGVKYNYTAHGLLAQKHKETAQDFEKRRNLADSIFSALFFMKSNGKLAKEYYKEAQKELELCQQLKLPFENLDNYLKQYSMVIPKTNVIKKLLNKAVLQNPFR